MTGPRALMPIARVRILAAARHSGESALSSSPEPKGKYKYVMLHKGRMSTVIAPPDRVEGLSPLLRTLHEVEAILRKAAADDEGPMSLAEIKRRMRAKSVRHATVRACVNELKRLHLLTEDPRRGVLWTLHEDPHFWSRKGFARL